MTTQSGTQVFFVLVTNEETYHRLSQFIFTLEENILVNVWILLLLPSSPKVRTRPLETFRV